MFPVSVDDCFGWVHAPAGGAGTDTAVVVCQGLMRDGLLAHCSFRLLGDELAAAGTPMLRFDYPGTGDSLDGAVATDRKSTRLNSSHIPLSRMPSSA